MLNSVLTPTPSPSGTQSVPLLPTLLSIRAPKFFPGQGRREKPASPSLSCSQRGRRKGVPSEAMSDDDNGVVDGVFAPPMEETQQRLPAIDLQTFLGSVMPKKEIGVDRFAQQYPHYDGRGIIMAIFDSGVDPAAAGLQTTSDGKPKILDMLDCTGSGDVDMSKIVKADNDGFIAGLSGRTLQVNKNWKNPSGEWRVGCKFAYELFSGSLVSRLKKDRKKRWDEKHSESIADALRQLAAFDQRNPKPSDIAIIKEREDLQNRVDLLRKLSDSYDDKGPVVDAVVWNDGDVWRVALDTQDFEETEAGKLADFVPMTNYRLERKYGIFSKIDACSYATNVYDNGNLLSIVTDSSLHGTHVAGITAAFHPEEPLLCGVAPGAQLISCKIGDSRLESMETGVGLVRALIAVVENKCNLINMSYGEPTSMPNYGRFVELANEVVNKYGVMFISSAGNAGPSLSTVGAPGGNSSSIVGIGAYVSPDMASSAHSLVEPPAKGLQYTWSSRGPTADGDWGVCLSAPGAAISPVPQWTLQRRMLANGTSMSSPCACGAIALILSGLKAENQSFTPWIVRKALENTAAPISNSLEERLTTGFGLLQVDKAFEYLQQCKGMPPMWYQVQLNRNGNTGPNLRGVYIRDSSDLQQESEWCVQIKTMFHEDADKLEVLVPYEERIQLISSNPSWVQAPDYLLLTNNGRTFNIVVNPRELEPGVHCAEIQGIDCSAPWRGPLFRVPITVLKPFEVSGTPPSILFSALNFLPAKIERRFVQVPIGSTWAEAIVTVTGFDTPRKFFINAVQLVSLKKPRKQENFVTFNGPSSKSFTFAVEGGLALEFTIAQFWSSGSGCCTSASADIKFVFHGLVSTSKEVVVNGSDMVTRISVKASLGTEMLAPVATLRTIRIPYRPTESKLEPLSADRDRLPNGCQILGLSLTYKFSLSESCKVRPRITIFNSRMYDNEIESQFYMIHDQNKRVFTMGDVYPKSVRLPKGDFTLRLHLRHDNVQLLERLKKLVIFLDRDLEEKNVVKLQFYSGIDGVVTGVDAFKSSTLISGENKPLFIASPSEDKLPKDASVGRLLLGKISYGSGKGSRLSLIIPPTSKVDEKHESNANDVKKSATEIMEEEVRAAKVKALSNLPRGTKDERNEWHAIGSNLKCEYPKHLPLFVEILQKIASTQTKADGKNGIEEVINAANAVIDLIDEDALAKFFAMKSDPEEKDAAKVRKEMEMQRDSLADALYKKGLALAQLDDDLLVDILLDQEVKHTEKVVEPKEPGIDNGTDEEGQVSGSEASAMQGLDSKDSFDETYAQLRKWVDISSYKYSLLTVVRELRKGRLGTALKVLNDMIEDEGNKPQKSLYKLQVRILEQIGWLHWACYEKKWMLVRFPPSLPLF